MRFNFRGTGASEGSFDQGRGEADDLRAVAAWVREQRPRARLWLAGFSFGSYITLKCANELHPGMVFTIEPGLYISADDRTVHEKWRGIGIRTEDDILVTRDGHKVLTDKLARSADEIEAFMADA